MSDYHMSKNKMKKIEKYCSILKKEFNISAKKEPPSRNIVWCNGGLASGYSREMIASYFSRFGVIKDILMIPKKSITFITYKNLESAINCNDYIEMQRNKFCKRTALSHGMFLLYVNKLPNIEIELRNSYLPPGAKILNDFVQPNEELWLLDYIDSKSGKWHLLKQRKVKHFGYEFIYGENSVKKMNTNEGVPLECNCLWDKMKDLSHQLPWLPDQLTVNCYEQGQGIPPHIDVHSIFEEYIVIMSLGSDVLMEFKNGDFTTYSHIPRRSLLILAGESRYAWTHGISTRTEDLYFDNDLGYFSSRRGEKRISFTFRRVRHVPCKCNYPLFCDSRITKNNIVKECSAIQIEKKYVHEIYDNIANHFSLTRHKPWPKVLEFINELPNGAVLLDIGCGNGKYFGFNPNIIEIGSEICPSLVNICYKRGFETVNNNILWMPIKDNMLDGIICIAVLHHLSTEQRRRNAIREIIRLLNTDGIALVYVWAKEQEYDNSHVLSKKDKQNVFTDTFNKKLEPDITLTVEPNRGRNFTRNDILVPWKKTVPGESNNNNNEAGTFLRYYHVFEENELEKLCISAGGVIISSYYDFGNWCVKFKKKDCTKNEK